MHDRDRLGRPGYAELATDQRLRAYFTDNERRCDMTEDTTAGTCPVCGGNLCVDVQYPDRVYCDTCGYECGSGS